MYGDGVATAQRQYYKYTANAPNSPRRVIFNLDKYG